jgi:hypothetical protein
MRSQRTPRRTCVSAPFHRVRCHSDLGWPRLCEVFRLPAGSGASGLACQELVHMEDSIPGLAGRSETFVDKMTGIAAAETYQMAIFVSKGFRFVARS